MSGRWPVVIRGSARYVTGLVSCLALWGICPGEAMLPAGGEVLHGDWQLASAEGIFHTRFTAGARVTAGQEIAQTRDSRGTVLERFAAHSDGLLLAVRSKACIRNGDWGVLVATNA